MFTPRQKEDRSIFFLYCMALDQGEKNPLIFGIPPQGENNGWEGKLFSPAEIEVGFLKIRLMVLFSPPDCQ